MQSSSNGSLAATLNAFAEVVVEIRGMRRSIAGEDNPVIMAVWLEVRARSAYFKGKP